MPAYSHPIVSNVEAPAVAVVVGAGPGLGTALARRFARAGMMVAVARRDRAALDAVLSPDAIADAYHQLHLQPPSAWTHELDLRPYVEKF